jgi:uncharacterized membrane protein YidH (DUF202 family)
MKTREEVEEGLMKKNPVAIEILLSKERTLLSRERTAIALGQLALALAAFGFLVIRFFVGDSGYNWFLIVGIGSVVLAAYLTYHAWKDYKHFQKELTHLHRKRGHLDEVYVQELEEL